MYVGFQTERTSASVEVAIYAWDAFARTMRMRETTCKLLDRTRDESGAK
jgi:hypothetical protein